MPPSPYGQSNFGPQQPVQPPQAPEQPKPGKRRRWVPWVAYPAVAIVGIAIGASTGGSSTPTASTAAVSKPAVTVTAPGKAAPTVTVTAPAPAETPAAVETEPAAPAAPVKTDFKLAVKTLKKQCFGSAGCNVTFRIDVTYSGPALDPSSDYEVTYAIKGGEDPQSNTFTVTGTQYTYDENEFIQTSKSSAKLTAVVTDVIAN